MEWRAFVSVFEGRKILAILICIIALAILSIIPSGQKYPELEDLSSSSINHERYFGALAEKKGASYAFEILRLATLPPGTDYHLIGHAIGDRLYKEKGIEGMVDCTPEFRNACSHSIVVGAFDEFGEGALPRISEACMRAPGGSGAYTMCFHGLGHGVFAYYEYDLEKTLQTCRKAGTPEHGFGEYTQCVGGTIMELGSGGGHDREKWLAARGRYLTEDPLSPCSTLVPQDARGLCYLYLTPRLLERAGADLSWPAPQFFKKAFTYCDGIPQDKISDRHACFGGFGKEFIVLALARDVRAVDQAREAELRTMWGWCTEAPHREGLVACMESIVGSLYWGGENAPDAALSFCALIPQDMRHSCFETLFTHVATYRSGDRGYKENICAKVPAEESSICTRALLDREKTASTP